MDKIKQIHEFIENKYKKLIEIETELIDKRNKTKIKKYIEEMFPSNYDKQIEWFKSFNISFTLCRPSYSARIRNEQFLDKLIEDKEAIKLFEDGCSFWDNIMKYTNYGGGLDPTEKSIKYLLDTDREDMAIKWINSNQNTHSRKKKKDILKWVKGYNICQYLKFPFSNEEA